MKTLPLVHTLDEQWALRIWEAMFRGQGEGTDILIE